MTSCYAYFEENNVSLTELEAGLSHVILPTHMLTKIMILEWKLDFL